MFSRFRSSPDGMALQRDGTLVAVFTTNVVRLNSDGSSDSAFLPSATIDATGYGNRVAVQPDGRILIGGGFTRVNDVIHNRILRLNPSGAIDETYERGGGIDGIVSQIRPLPDGKIFISGGFTTVKSTNRISFARLYADGSGDTTFRHDFSAGYLYRNAVQGDGKILWAGLNGLGRLNIYASTDAAFNPDLGPLPPFAQYFRGNDIVSQPDGKAICAGAAVEYRCDPDGECGDILTPFFYRFDANGARDPSFNAPADLDVSRLLLQPDGKLLAAARSLSSNVWKVVRFNTNGALDNSFEPAVVAGVLCIAVQPDRKVLLGGGFAGVNGVGRRCVARLNANGTLDNSFNPFIAGSSRVNTLTLQPDGKILIGGVFTQVNGTNRSNLARLNPNGTLDLSVNVKFASRSPDYGPEIYATSLLGDGSFLIGGEFLTVNGVLRPYIARLYGDFAQPLLQIAQSNSAIVFSWPAAFGNYQLQENSDINLLNAWAAVGLPPATNGISLSVSIPIGNDMSKFFRLQSF